MIEDDVIRKFKTVLANRKEYIREQLAGIEESGRDQQPKMKKMLRGGMLSELTTMECVLTMLEQGNDEPLQYWPQAPVTTE